MLYQDCELSRERAVDMRTEVGRNRLEARLHKPPPPGQGFTLRGDQPA